MKRILLGLVVVAALSTAVVFSGPGEPRKDLQFQVEERNPVTHLRINPHVDDFQFALVSDRTGGHRANVFSQAVERLNLLQPAFVVSVGDLIEGGGRKPQQKIQEEWKEFDSFVNRLQMPFFYVAGNHDVAAAATTKFWHDKLGRTYYHFVYRSVLFLLLNSDDPPGSNAHISKDQIHYAAKVLADNKQVRWTIVVVHRPLWTANDLTTNGWEAIETALKDRRYTVFAGHVHQYKKFVRNGQNYYQLATTGGVSRLRGIEEGEFDQIAWVTMKKDGPLLANILIEDVLTEDLQRPTTNEEVTNRKMLNPVKGRVFYEGGPIPGAQLVLHAVKNAGTKRPVGTIQADGSFRLSTSTAFDGAREGEYIATVTWKKSADIDAANFLPARYADPKTSDLRANVVAGNNELVLELKK